MINHRLRFWAGWWLFSALVLLLAVAPAAAGLEEGRQAYHNGDFATALQEFLPLAQAGDLTMQNQVAAMIGKMYGQQIGFAQWMAFGIPLSAITLVFCWYLLTRLLYPMGKLSLASGAQIIDHELQQLGPMKKEEKYIVAVGCVVAFCWIIRGFIKIPELKMVHDATIGIAGALILFALPTDFKKGTFLLDWKTAVKIPWDVILLFGGGLAIANGFTSTGLAGWIAGNLSSLQSLPPVVFVMLVVTITMAMTELTSNTATATLLIPIMGSAAVALGINPYATIIGACVASSFAFMLPVSTPPNAVVFGSGCITIPQMAKSGVLLNLFGVFAITLLTFYLLPILWGIDLSHLPAWAMIQVPSTVTEAQKELWEQLAASSDFHPRSF